MINNNWVELTFEGAVATLLLKRVDSGNALNLDMVMAIKEAIDTVAASRQVRSLLITSAHRHIFCVGGDIAYMSDNSEHLQNTLQGLLIPWHQTLLTLSRLPVGVVLEVNGVVGGGGLGLLWAADHVLASESSRFVTGFAKLGLSCDSGISWYLPKLVGGLRAKELLLENRMLDASTACQWGMINQVVPDDQLSRMAKSKAKQFSQLSLTATAAIKQLLESSGLHSYPEHLTREMNTILQCAEQSDAQEGLAAFLTRRSPVFKDARD